MRKIVFVFLIMVMLIAVSAPSFAKVELSKISGYIYSTYQEETVTVNCTKDKQLLNFEYPEDTDFCVKILGETGKHLADFHLSNGSQISLTGSGIFTLVVYSRSGTGAWSADVVSDSETGTTKNWE